MPEVRSEAEDRLAPLGQASCPARLYGLDCGVRDGMIDTVVYDARAPWIDEVFAERVGLDCDATLPLITRHWFIRVRIIALSLGSRRNVVCAGILQDTFRLVSPL